MDKFVATCWQIGLAILLAFTVFTLILIGIFVLGHVMFWGAKWAGLVWQILDGWMPLPRLP